MPQAMCFWPFRPFPSAADLFDVQSFFNHMVLIIFELMKFVEICRSPTDRREVIYVEIRPYQRILAKYQGIIGRNTTLQNITKM